MKKATSRVAFFFTEPSAVAPDPGVTREGREVDSADATRSSAGCESHSLLLMDFQGSQYSEMTLASGATALGSVPFAFAKTLSSLGIMVLRAPLVGINLNYHHAP